MHDRVEWVMPSDRVILTEFARYDGWLKPSSVYLNVGLSQQHVQRRCKAMAEHSVLQRHPDEVAYRVTELGRDWHTGRADADDLRR